jgi:hypothetical protein
MWDRKLLLLHTKMIGENKGKTESLKESSGRKIREIRDCRGAIIHLAKHE